MAHWRNVVSPLILVLAFVLLPLKSAAWGPFRTSGIARGPWRRQQSPNAHPLEVAGVLGRLSLEQGARPTNRRQLYPAGTRWTYRQLKRRRRQDDCWSKHEQHLFYKRIPMTEAMEDALHKYELMHQRCTNVSDWGQYASILFWDKDKERGSLQGCKYIVLVDPAWHGLGNRIINLVSTFALALATNRALLIKGDSPIADFFCSPFRHSNWALDDNQWRHFIDTLWKGGVRHVGDLKKADFWDSWKDRRAMNIAVSWNSGPNQAQFFCPEHHENVFQYIPVLVVDSDEWYAPALYYVPSLAKELDRLMPDGRLFTHIGRYLLHPTNKVWLQVTRFYDAYLAHHTKLVGVQIRKFWECPVPVESRVLECAYSISKAIPTGNTTEEFLQQMAEARGERQQWDAGPGDGGRQGPPGGRRESVGVFVTSLNRTYSDILTEQVLGRVPQDQQLVAVYSLSHEGMEKHDNSQYEVALVEMLLLSMTDTLLTTDYSTFGYVAAGLSGDLPHSMNIVVTGGGDWRTNGRPACEVISSEPCFHRFPSDTLQCKGWSKAKELTEIHPDVGFCDGVGTGLMHKIHP